MNAEGYKRKLTAILSADVQGYSRLMGDNEPETVRTLTSYREAITNLIQDYNGRVVDSPGDNLLAEFISVVQAVECAVEIQKNLKSWNEELPDNRRMEFRIGINLGDVIEEGNRIYGDGVNIAARLEGLAEGGGICISGTVYDHIENKLDLNFDDLGEHTVKNIPKPIRIYKIPKEPERIAKTERKKKSFSEPENPAIAVLPFVNMSNDPDQEYFSDGMTEEIITRLSMNPMLTVIARNSTFIYKGKPVKVQQVGQELGVRYVLEGSIRKAGNMVRITAQLIDTTTDGHLWAKTYDRELNDIFAVQDEIAQQIAVNIGGFHTGVFIAERARSKRMHTENLTAYDCWLRGMSHFMKFTKEELAKAQEMHERAIKLDPEYASAYLGLGWKYHMDYILWGGDPQALEHSFELARKAISLDDNTLTGHALLANVYNLKGQYELALAETEKAISLNPNDAMVYVIIGSINNRLGKPAKALEAMKKAMQLNPHHDVGYLTELSRAYRGLGKYKDAISSLNKALAQNRNYPIIYPELAFNYLWQWITQQETDTRVLDKALEISKQGLALEENFIPNRLAMGNTYLWKKQHDQAILEAEKVSAIDSDRAGGYGILASIMNYMGKHEEAIEMAEKAMRINSRFILTLSHAYRLVDKPGKALAMIEQHSKSDLIFSDSFLFHIESAILYSELGHEEKGRSEAAEILKLVPNFSVEIYGQRVPYKDPALAERDMNYLRKVGLL